MQFYVLVLLIAPWIRSGRWWIVAAVFVGIAWAWRYGVTVFVSPSPQSGVFPLFFVSTQLPGMLDEFVAGLLLARLVRTERGQKILGGGYLSQVVLLGLTVAAIAVSLGVIYWRYASYWNVPLMVTFWRTSFAIAAALLIFLTITIKVNKRIRFLASPLYYLGTISYGIYLWHLPVLLSIKRIEWLRPEAALIWIVALTCVFASVSWHFFEKPIMNRIRQKPAANKDAQ